MTVVPQNAPQFHQVGTKMLQDIGKRGKNEIIVTEKL